MFDIFVGFVEDSLLTSELRRSCYCHDLKYLERQVWANSAEPDQTAPDQDLHCLLFCSNFWMDFCMVKPGYLNSRIITAILGDCPFFVIVFLQ